MTIMSDNIRIMLGNLAHVGVISDDAVKAIHQVVMNEVDGWRGAIADELKSKIASWENLEFDGKPSTMSNTGLYSLGLRQAVDLILEEKPLEEPPVLETDADVEIDNLNEPPEEDG